MARTPQLEVMSRRRRAVVGLLLGAVVCGLLQWLRGTEAFERPELALVDVRTNAYVGMRPPDPRIVLAVVGEDDLRRMNALVGAEMDWPWPQEMQAFAVEFLRQAGAAVLLCDFVYLDRGVALDEVDPRTVEVEGPQLEEELRQAKLLGKALAAFRRAAVGVYMVQDPKHQLPGREALADARSLVPPGENGLPPGTPTYAGVDLSVAAILEGAAWGGAINAVTDVDGVDRAAHPVFQGGRWLWPSLAMAGAALLTNDAIAVSRDGIRIGERPIPLSEDGEFLINFRGTPAATYAQVSVYNLVVAGNRLMAGEPPTPEDLETRREVEGKVVVWGASFTADFDIRPTPTSRNFLGPELHATVLDNLLHGDGRVRVARWINLVVLAALCLVLGALGAAMRSRLLPNLVTLVVMAALVGVGFLLFRAGWSIDLFTPLLACVAVTLVASTFRLMTEGRRNRWLEATFGRYLSPEVIAALKDDPSRLALGGRRRDLTVFFSDVEGFTTISEKLEPEQVVQLLNRYLTDQTEELMRENGVIDKFEGDAIMAFFGDPLDVPDHAAQACRAAVRCRSALPRLEALWRELGLTRFDMRIGLNSGPALVGNMGSESRFDYTCMGDAVNLASRLEGANKVFGSKIMIGPQTYAEAGDRILTKKLADVVVLGRTEAVPVFELIAMADDATDAERTHVNAYNRAHYAVHAGELQLAREALDQAEAAAPGDGPCAWLRTLIDRLEAGELETPWDGLLVLDSK